MSGFLSSKVPAARMAFVIMVSFAVAMVASLVVIVIVADAGTRMPINETLLFAAVSIWGVSMLGIAGSFVWWVSID